MKYYLISGFFLLAFINARSQQLQSSSMYELQSIMHNPSVAGTLQHGMIGASYRTQWSGISGSPKTATVFGSFDLPKQTIGIGGYIYNDETGPTSRTGLDLSLAKHIVFKNNSIFSLGIELKGQQYSIDRNKLTQTLGADPALGTSNNKSNFDAGFGMSYTSEKFQIGASVSQLIQSKLNYYTGSLSTTDNAMLYRHYYLHGMYKWDVDGYTTISPNFILTYLPNAPTELQAGIKVEHHEVFWWAISLRTEQSFTLSAGVRFQKKLSIGYAFDIYNTPLSVFDKGSNAHEVMLRYDIFK